MTSPEPLSPGRYRAALILGLVLALACLVIGVVVVVLNLNPLFGWFFLAVGAIVTVLSIVQLYRSNRS
ncbi:hypothetical protein NY547_11025 [Cnuibacter physcomitrellae]|uniref:hypothetical protein n=1 Tax=Cnuibacter physcomitrellae TaxID=1619308 RepID=UPI002175A6C8|nr:hypothetical protein [Cnuibacter physcomitrellae]MCS5497769.1 hypothetical protein [Cnuibacter physcomitrellae]